MSRGDIAHIGLVGSVGFIFIALMVSTIIGVLGFGHAAFLVAAAALAVAFFSMFALIVFAAVYLWRHSDI